MTTMASQITSFTVVYSTVYLDADQRKHQSSASLAFVWGNHQDPDVNHDLLENMLSANALSNDNGNMWRMPCQYGRMYCVLFFLVIFFSNIIGLHDPSFANWKYNFTDALSITSSWYDSNFISYQ